MSTAIPKIRVKNNLFLEVNTPITYLSKKIDDSGKEYTYKYWGHDREVKCEIIFSYKDITRKKRKMKASENVEEQSYNYDNYPYGYKNIAHLVGSRFTKKLEPNFKVDSTPRSRNGLPVFNEDRMQSAYNLPLHPDIHRNYIHLRQESPRLTYILYFHKYNFFWSDLTLLSPLYFHYFPHPDPPPDQ